MTDRQIVYPGAAPADTDILGLQRDIMIAIGYLAQAAIGTGPVVWGLPGAQTTVPGMTINIGPGAIASLATVDASAFGSLSSDANPLVKIGINEGTTSFTLTAPGTSGQSINYLIEAAFLESDGTPVVLPYYNASNPSSPYLGPANSGVAQNTQRLQRCSLQLKPGVAATTGTQTTPAVDSGWVGLYVITVNYGQTTVLTGGIAPYTPSSFLGFNLGTLGTTLFGTAHNVTGSRAVGVIYTNTTGRPMFVSAACTSVGAYGNLQLFVNGAPGFIFGQQGGSAATSTCGVVPAGATYEAVATVTAVTINNWVETY